MSLYERLTTLKGQRSYQENKVSKARRSSDLARGIFKSSLFVSVGCLSTYAGLASFYPDFKRYLPSAVVSASISAVACLASALAVKKTDQKYAHALAINHVPAAQQLFDDVFERTLEEIVNGGRYDSKDMKRCLKELDGTYTTRHHDALIKRRARDIDKERRGLYSTQPDDDFEDLSDWDDDDDFWKKGSD